MTFCQYLAQDTAVGVGSARSWGLHWGASPHSSSALHLPCSTRSLLRVFQVGHEYHQFIEEEEELWITEERVSSRAGGE
ncbi:uncharacterized protein [Nerophis lumbriciformis]|uniref:uncharacterized protein isoform X2 n=1 Tax=Nerophis lumbriciformis TaxID=546530 RepID=UPI003BAAAF1C